MSTRVREANPVEVPAVLNVLDGALLETDYEGIESAIETGDVLVAVEESGTGDEQSADNAELLGVLVLDGEEIVAVAVRRRRRGQEVGSVLVDAAGDRHERLVAHFRKSVRPFWESLGFDIESTAEDGRFRGVLHTA